MKEPVVIIGLGEMGGVFARGLLRDGHPVYPITRDMDMQAEARALPAPELVLVAVAETDLHPVLERLPEPWRARVALLQNELLPPDWQRHGLDPTVISVWFEKKPGQEAKVIIPSPVHGPHAGLLAQALSAIGIPTEIVDSDERMLFELVRKNLYILVSNLCGLEVGGTVGELWSRHRTLAREVAHEVLQIQQWLTGREFDEEALVGAMAAAFLADPGHKCMGRSAPARLQRALKQAREAGLDLPRLAALGRRQEASRTA